MAFKHARPAAAALLSLMVLLPARAAAQDHTAHAAGTHEMYMRPLGGGWTLMGMAQLYPIVSTGFGSGANDAITDTEPYLTQPALMFNVESPGQRVTFRTTLNFEGITLEDGELTFGGWGEGFIDRRHPHTLVHEAMLSLNLWQAAGGALSLSAGKGFAPYGTDDPMSRPAVKYPTNHHLSQILERFTANVVYIRGGWGVEAGIFGGAEPTGPYDFSNIESFGDSWSARLTRRFGGTGTSAPWELSASYGYVVEEHDGVEEATRLVNAAIRHQKAYGAGSLYGLVEASRSTPDGDEDGFFSVLGEARLSRGAHQPYVRMELATRPEYDREGVPGQQGFYRYDHDEHARAATRWFITTVGYNLSAGLPLGARPFVELQHNNVAGERGGVSARELFGTTNFLALTAGFRLNFGGEPMRMGGYGVLDAMTEAMRPVPAPGMQHRHE